MCADKRNNLRGCELSKREWDIAAQLRATLKIFKDGTLFFSGATPNLAQVIPAIDQVDRHLSTVSTLHHKYDNAIRVACALAKATLNKYYSYTDFSITYRIATILHPRHKLEYFKRMRWPEAW
ncbi:hypothetical protein C8Q76DRAFT_604778, partial [Earliella scabrosa]